MKAIGKRVGILLAGGASKRMRQDKSSLQFEGESLLQRGCSLLNALKVDSVIDDFVLSCNVDFKDIKKIADEFPNQGPVGGIFATIKSLQLKQNDLVLALPVDMPLLDFEHLNQLVEVSSQRIRSVCYDNAWLPISLVITNELLKAIGQQVAAEKGLSVRQVFELSQGELLEPKNAQCLINVNTPEQWQRLSSL